MGGGAAKGVSGIELEYGAGFGTEDGMTCIIVAGAGFDGQFRRDKALAVEIEAEHGIGSFTHGDIDDHGKVVGSGLADGDAAVVDGEEPDVCAAGFQADCAAGNKVEGPVDRKHTAADGFRYCRAAAGSAAGMMVSAGIFETSVVGTLSGSLAAAMAAGITAAMMVIAVLAAFTVPTAAGNDTAMAAAVVLRTAGIVLRTVILAEGIAARTGGTRV